MLLSSGYLSVDVGLKGCTTKSFNANVSKTKDHTPMHIIQSTAIIFPSVVMLSQLPVGEARDTLDNTQENNHTHSQSLQRSGQSPIHPSSKCMFLGGSQSTRREPTHTHGENMQTPQRNP